MQEASELQRRTFVGISGCELTSGIKAARRSRRQIYTSPESISKHSNQPPSALLDRLANLSKSSQALQVTIENRSVA